ncbi:TPA: helix-turn-helix domain-containing protein [Vibrio parahaemolyticus]|nr:helix-turn-helix domain-containing protein [Vibrio parahaemolyticus]HCG8179532.1 helix-turn-helix domain-containing protein [Vibrio parahaemolyticus]
MKNEFEIELLSVDNVAKILDVHRTTVYRWSKKGILPAQVDMVGKSRWDKAELYAWIRKLPKATSVDTREENLLRSVFHD